MQARAPLSEVEARGGRRAADADAAAASLPRRAARARVLAEPRLTHLDDEGARARGARSDFVPQRRVGLIDEPRRPRGVRSRALRIALLALRRGSQRSLRMRVPNVRLAAVARRRLRVGRGADFAHFEERQSLRRERRVGSALHGGRGAPRAARRRAQRRAAIVHRRHLLLRLLRCGLRAAAAAADENAEDVAVRQNSWRPKERTQCIRSIGGGRRAAAERRNRRARRERHRPRRGARRRVPVQLDGHGAGAAGGARSNAAQQRGGHNDVRRGHRRATQRREDPSDALPRPIAVGKHDPRAAKNAEAPKRRRRRDDVHARISSGWRRAVGTASAGDSAGAGDAGAHRVPPARPRRRVRQNQKPIHQCHRLKKVQRQSTVDSVDSRLSRGTR